MITLCLIEFADSHVEIYFRTQGHPPQLIYKCWHYICGFSPDGRYFLLVDDMGVRIFKRQLDQEIGGEK